MAQRVDDQRRTGGAGYDASSPRTWILTDGAAGNFKQAQVLARGLGLVASEYCVQLRALDRAFAPRFRRAKFTDLLLQPLPESLNCAVAIGCGRAGAIALDAIKRAKPSIRTIQILAPRCDPARFDAIVCPAHDQLDAPNVYSMIGALNGVDDAWLAAGRGQNIFAPVRTLLLVGAPTRNAPYTVAQFARLLHSLDADGLCISASRRTPADFLWHIRQSGARIWAGDSDGENPYQAWLSQAGKIFVTADSVNMISEACATYAPVEVAFAQHAQGKIALFLDSLASRLAQSPPEITPLRTTAEAIQRLRAGLFVPL
jgi:uncharacterized protein